MTQPSLRERNLPAPFVFGSSSAAMAGQTTRSMSARDAFNAA